MGKNLMPKIIVITVLVVVAGLTLYPPSKKLKPGPDLGGGTSLIYQIDTQGLEEIEKRDLSQRMITVLRRRIRKYKSVKNYALSFQACRRTSCRLQ